MQWLEKAAQRSLRRSRWMAKVSTSLRNGIQMSSQSMLVQEADAVEQVGFNIPEALQAL